MWYMKWKKFYILENDSVPHLRVSCTLRKFKSEYTLLCLNILKICLNWCQHCYEILGFKARMCFWLVSNVSKKQCKYKNQNLIFSFATCSNSCTIFSSPPDKLIWGILMRGLLHYLLLLCGWSEPPNHVMFINWKTLMITYFWS